MRVAAMVAALILGGCASPAAEKRTSGGAAGDAGDPGAGGSSDPDVVVGPAPVQVDGVGCTRTEEAAVITATEGAVPLLGCSIPDAGWNASFRMDRSGAVSSVSATTFDMDTCAAGACATPPLRVSIVAPGLDLRRSLVPGATVRVRGNTGFFYACTTGLAVESLPSLNGVTNPASADAGLYVAVHEGGGERSDAYQVDTVRLPCPGSAGDGCGGEQPGLYAFKLTAGSGTKGTWFLPMGRTISVEVPGSADRWRARNLRSYQTDYCDDYWNWALWIALDRPSITGS